MIKKLILPVLLLTISIGNAQGKKAKTYELASPGGQNKIKFELVNNAPKYAVSHGKTEVLTPSDMGFTLKNNENLSSNFEITNIKNSKGERKYVNCLLKIMEKAIKNGQGFYFIRKSIYCC